MVLMDINALTARLREYTLTEDLASRLRDLQALGVGQLVRSVEKLHLLEAGRPIRDASRFFRVVRDEIIPLLEEYCYEDYDALHAVLEGEYNPDCS